MGDGDGLSTIAVTLITSGSIAFLTALVGFTFQQFSAYNERKRNKRDLDMKRAEEALEDISTGMDKLYYYLKHHAYPIALRRRAAAAAADGEKAGISKNEHDQKNWEGFIKSMEEWWVKWNYNSARATSTFGPDGGLLLKEIHRDFGNACLIVRAIYYGKDYSATTEEEEATTEQHAAGEEDNKETFVKLMAELKDKILCMNMDMVRDIQDQNVGGLRTTVENAYSKGYRAGANAVSMTSTAIKSGARRASSIVPDIETGDASLFYT